MKMQKGEEVYLTGLELLMVMLAGVSLPRPEYNKMMKDLIAALKAKERPQNQTQSPSALYRRTCRQSRVLRTSAAE